MNLATLWSGLLVSDINLEKASAVVKGHPKQKRAKNEPPGNERQVEFAESITSGNQTRNVSWTYSTVSGLDAESGEFQKELRQVSSTLDVKAGKLDSVNACAALSEVDLFPATSEFSVKAQRRSGGSKALAQLIALELKTSGAKTKLSLEVEPQLRNKNKDLALTVSLDLFQCRQPKLAVRTGRAFSSDAGKVKDTHTVELDLKKKRATTTLDLKSVQTLDQGKSVYALHTKGKASPGDFKSLAQKLVVKSSARSAAAISAGWTMKKGWQSLCLPLELELKLPEDKKVKFTYEQCCKGEGASKFSVQCKKVLPKSFGFEDLRVKIERTKKIELRAQSSSASLQLSLPYNLACTVPPLITIYASCQGAY
jgi:hypothetical protein